VSAQALLFGLSQVKSTIFIAHLKTKEVEVLHRSSKTK